MLLRGEWFLDSTEGMPWQGEVLGKQPRASYDWAIRQRMLGTPGVTGISDRQPPRSAKPRPERHGNPYNPMAWPSCRRLYDDTLYRSGDRRRGHTRAELRRGAAILQDQYRNIYGADTYLEADSQDGQLLAVFAMAIHDANTAAVQVYNAFSPATASGEALSSNVKINGLARGVATRSSVDLRIVGQSGTTIAGGVALDGDRVQWELPASVTIPPAGEITVTALCRQVGAVAAAPGSITRIGTPTLGWQSVTNPPPPRPARPSKATRRCGSGKPCRWRCRRAPCWKARSARGVRAGRAAPRRLRERHGRRGRQWPAAAQHRAGGGRRRRRLIASAIAAKKTPGTGTHGSTTVVVTDIYGIAHPIRFFRPVRVPVSAEIQMRALVHHGHGPGGAAGGGGLHQWRGHRRRRQRVRGMGRRHLGANGVAGSGTFKITGLALSRSSGNGAPTWPWPSTRRRRPRPTRSRSR